MSTLYWDNYCKGTRTCWDFTCDMWNTVTGQDLRDLIKQPIGIPAQARFYAKQQQCLIPLQRKKDPCLAFMLGVERLPHVGVYHRQAVFHLDNCGVLAQDLSTIRLFYPKVLFYDVPLNLSN